MGRQNNWCLFPHSLQSSSSRRKREADVKAHTHTHIRKVIVVYDFHLQTGVSVRAFGHPFPFVLETRVLSAFAHKSISPAGELLFVLLCRRPGAYTPPGTVVSLQGIAIVD